MSDADPWSYHGANVQPGEWEAPARRVGRITAEDHARSDAWCERWAAEISRRIGEAKMAIRKKEAA